MALGVEPSSSRLLLCVKPTSNPKPSPAPLCPGSLSPVPPWTPTASPTQPPTPRTRLRLPPRWQRACNYPTGVISFCPASPPTMFCICRRASLKTLDMALALSAWLCPTRVRFPSSILEHPVPPGSAKAQLTPPAPADCLQRKDLIRQQQERGIPTPPAPHPPRGGKMERRWFQKSGFSSTGSCGAVRGSGAVRGGRSLCQGRFSWGEPGRCLDRRAASPGLWDRVGEVWRAGISPGTGQNVRNR